MPTIYDAYVRVSNTHGEDGLSVPQQLEKIQGWIDQHDGIEIGLRPEDGKPFTDLDVSGGSMDRPELNRVLSRIADGTSQGIIVAYMSRFGRTLEAGTVIKKIEDLGGQVVSVRDDFDTSTPTGEAMRAIALVFAELELANIKDGWSSHVRMAIDEGRAVGSIPLGYRRERNGKIRKDGTHGYGPLMKDDETADLIWRAFDLAGAYGLQAALDHLRESFPDRRWTATLAAELLANRLYLGELSHGTEGEPNVYMKRFEELRIVTLAEYQAAQHKPHVNGRQRRAPDFPLAGIATCASCGRGLVASVRQNAARRYRCTNRDCPGRAFPRADDLERHVLDAIRRDPPKLNDEETIRLQADVEGTSAALESHDGKRAAYEALDELEVWEQRRAELVHKLDVARVAAMPDQVAPLPELSREDLTPGDLRFVFERAVASCTVAPANGQRGCIDKLVSLKLRS